MSFAEMSLATFADELAAASAAPGGGSAAALAGTLGAALVAMVCRITVGRKNYESVSDEFSAILPRADALRAELLELTQKDADAYARVMEAYQLPKETADDKNARTEAIQAALKNAAEVPFQVATACAQVVEMSRATAARGNKNATSDAGAGALLAEAGLRAAILNVEINLGLIHDAEFTSRLRAQLEPLKQVALKRQAILDAVQARI
jgi:formiminotetrahydrofolate cyclodeaminase